MKPLELSFVTEVWKSALSILGKELEPVGNELQIWFPWGKTWRGHDSKGNLPPTDLPSELVAPSKVTRFGGRAWRAIPAGGISWLLSLKTISTPKIAFEAWIPPETVINSLKLLSDFIKLECILGLAMKTLENLAQERTGHWDRVRNLAVVVGKHMGLSDRELADLELAALLHDIGKVALPGNILGESRPLSPAERKTVETHSIVGATMIKEIPGMDRVADCVMNHHEAPDGTGYPKGLKAPEIPLGALIVGAADAFDAMTHFRPYASERTYKESIFEMIKNPGKFDDRVLWALQDVLKKLGILDVRPMPQPPSQSSPNS